MSLSDEFFAKALGVEGPVSIDFTGEYPVVKIHDPEDPEAFVVIAGILAAFDALNSGAEEVTDEMVAKAAVAARAILDQSIAALDHVARQTMTVVEFSDEESNEPEADDPGDFWQQFRRSNG
jgi:hypothetical protein